MFNYLSKGTVDPRSGPLRRVCKQKLTLWKLNVQGLALPTRAQKGFV